MALMWARGSGVVLGLFVAVWALGGQPLLAQTPPSPETPQLAPSRQQADLGERLPQAPAARLSGTAPVITPGEEPGAAPAPEEAFSFRLNGVNITRATVYDEGDFSPLYEEFVGADVTLGNLREIADRIEAMYRDDGYVATRAIIPPQAIADGVPTIEVYEGTVVYYEINGEIGPVKKQIAKLLDNLITGKPAKWSHLERWLLLARDLPGISLTGTLRSAGDTAPGGIVVVVDTARKPIDGFVNLQNLGSHPTGPLTLSGGLALNSNTAVGERIGAVALNTVLEPLEQQSGFLSYQQSLGGSGLLFKSSATLTRSQPGDQLERLKLQNNSLVANLHLEYPVMRGRKFSLWTRGGFEYLDQSSTLRSVSAGADDEVFDDQVRVVLAGLRGVWRPWGGGLTQFDVQFRQGLKILGAATAAGGDRSRQDARPDFQVVRGEIEHLQPFGQFWAIDIRGVGQYSTKPLASIEEMALGDLTIGRGFESGLVTGDRGLGVAAELRFSTPDFVSESLQKYIDRVEIYGFFDHALTYDKSIGSGEWIEQYVTSTGFGFRLQVLRTFYADFYYAIPLDKQGATALQSEVPGNGFYFNITKFF